IHAGAAVENIGDPVVEGRLAVQEVRAVQPARDGAQQMTQPRVVVGIGPAPFSHDRHERGDVAVVGGVTADQDVAAAAGSETAGACAGDEDVPAAAARERVVSSLADENIVGGAAGAVQGAVGADQGRHGQATGQTDLVGAVSAVDDDVGERHVTRRVDGCSVSPVGKVDGHIHPVVGTRAQREVVIAEIVVGGGDVKCDGILAGDGGIGFDGRRQKKYINNGHMV